jgi:hypothetical protein
LVLEQGADFCFFRSPLFIEWPDRMVSDRQHVMCEGIFHIGLPRFMTRFLTIMVGMTAPTNPTTSLIDELECVITSHDGKPSHVKHNRDSRRTRGIARAAIGPGASTCCSPMSACPEA